MTRRALIGVADRSGVISFARGLVAAGWEIVATDGTRAHLMKEGITARPVSEVTGHPEMLSGRVKTLHPAVHAGILARRDDEDHMAQMEERGYPLFDLIAVSLYPFAETVASGADHAAVIEKIDIGGPTMIRAAAKNSESVAVVVSPDQYDDVLTDIEATGEVSVALRHRLAAQAFRHVAAYDTAVAAYLTSVGDEDTIPEAFSTGGHLIAGLRYGENPHQRGGLYAIPGMPTGLAHARQLQGPGMSFTNWLDVDAARRVVAEFTEPAAAVIKHTNPCGFAIGSSIADAYRRAYDCDPRAAYGGIVALNGTLDESVVEALGTTFLEVVVAPAVTPEAAALLAKRERLRILVAEPAAASTQWDVRSIDGGLLVQDADTKKVSRDVMDVTSQRHPTAEEWDDLLIAWRVCRHVKSNAIVIVKDGRAVGVGAGQMSRVEAAELAVKRAGDLAQGAVAASDAFFPMPDGVETLADAGVVAVIQPGGSKGDGKVLEAADARGVAMVTTGHRHFRH